MHEYDNFVLVAALYPAKNHVVKQHLRIFFIRYAYHHFACRAHHQPDIRHMIAHHQVTRSHHFSLLSVNLRQHRYIITLQVFVIIIRCNRIVALMLWLGVNCVYSFVDLINIFGNSS